MRRRLSLTMVAMVIGALLFAGLATLGLTDLNSVQQTQSELVIGGEAAGPRGGGGGDDREAARFPGRLTQYFERAEGALTAPGRSGRGY